MILEIRCSCLERTRRDIRCYMEVRIVGIVPEIFKRIDAWRRCEDLYRIHVGVKLGAC
jgi:hypothetical protein